MAISLNLPEKLEKEVDRLVREGYYASKSSLVRNAIRDEIEDLVEESNFELPVGNKFERHPLYYSEQEVGKELLFGRPTRLHDIYTFRSYPISIEFNEFREMLAELCERFDLAAEDAIFSISQTNYSWYGRGASEFLSCIEEQSERYESVDNLHVHHSETSMIKFRGPSNLDVYISADIRSSGELNVLNRFEVKLVYGGVPFDNRKLLNLFDKYNVKFEPGHQIDKVQEMRADFSENNKLQLEVVDELAPRAPRYSDREDDWIGNLYVKNPFYEDHQLVEKYFGHSDSGLKEGLTEIEYLYCDLDQHYTENENVDYQLSDLRLAKMSEAVGGRALSIYAGADHIRGTSDVR